MSTSFIFFGWLLILLHYFTEKQQLKTMYNYCFIPRTYLWYLPPNHPPTYGQYIRSHISSHKGITLIYLLTSRKKMSGAAQRDLICRNLIKIKKRFQWTDSFLCKVRTIRKLRTGNGQHKNRTKAQTTVCTTWEHALLAVVLPPSSWPGAPADWHWCRRDRPPLSPVCVCCPQTNLPHKQTWHCTSNWLMICVACPLTNLAMSTHVGLASDHTHLPYQQMLDWPMISHTLSISTHVGLANDLTHTFNINTCWTGQWSHTHLYQQMAPLSWHINKC